MLIVMAVACLARMWVFGSAVDSVYFANPSLDAATNWQTAQLWAFEDGPERPFFKAPLYPFAASLSITALGADPKLDLMALGLVIVLQTLLGIITALCAWHIGRCVAGDGAGLFAGVACGLGGALIHFEFEILDAAMATCLMALGLALWLQRQGDPGAARTLFAGICWGLAVATRPTMFAPVALLALIAVRRPKHAALLMSPVLLCILVIAWANGFATPIATYGGPNFWLANHEGADGFTTRVPQVYGDPRDGEDYIERFALAEASQTLGHEATGVEADRHFRAKAMDFWSEQPLQATLMAGKRGLLFWQGPEIRNNRSLPFVGEQIPPLGVLMKLVSWYWLAPLGIVGLFMALRAEDPHRRRCAWALLACVLGLFLAALPFPVTSRYRVAALPLLCVASGVMAMGLASLHQRRQRGSAVVVLGWTLGLLLFATLDWTRGSDERERWRDWWQLGNAAADRGLVERGDYDLAEQAYLRALELKPDHFESQVNMARVLILRGDHADARAQLQALRWQAPQSAVLPTMMAQSHLREGNLEEGRRLLEEALEIDPQHVPAQEALQALLDTSIDQSTP